MFGMPYYLIGTYLRIHEPHTVQTNITILGVCIGLVMSAIEYLRFGSYDVHLGSFIVSISLFRWCIALVQNQSGRTDKWAAVGRRDTLFVYLIHPIVSQCFHIILIRMGNLQKCTVWLWLSPVAVLMVSFVSAELFDQIKIQIKRKEGIQMNRKF